MLEGEGPASRSKLWQETSPAGLHASRDSFYRTARSGRQDRTGVTQIPLTLLPRLCPLCGNQTIIGHGRRLKQADDEMAHADLDSPGPLSPMPKDIHCAARLVATIRDLQPPLPAKSRAGGGNVQYDRRGLLPRHADSSATRPVLHQTGPGVRWLAGRRREIHDLKRTEEGEKEALGSSVLR